MRRSLGPACVLLVCSYVAASAKPVPPSFTVPRVDRPPRLEDFDGMAPDPGWEGKLARVDGFTQIRPGNGTPPTQRTEAFLGYDDANLYVIFVCFDTDPGRIRARLVPRETFVDATGGGLDDLVSITLDTFHDQRRGYAFQVNPLGVQWDALFSESTGYDTSFDAVWYSRGKLTSTGYLVWVALPFKSLRFQRADAQSWGILLNRDIPRNSESLYWPRYDTNTAGTLNKAADMGGLQHISPGRNLQLIPYDTFRSYRALDLRDPAAPAFTTRAGENRAGLDAKVVLGDRVVVDLAVNPDFSQVESDEPQETVNQRFEVFFPEKRPFFLENAAFFSTPNNLVFTRRIGAPEFGARVTGKMGRTAFGALLADDQGPGLSVPPGDPAAGKHAFFGVLRASEDIFSQSTIGALYTSRAFDHASNQVGGVDTHLRLGEHWTVDGQAVASATAGATGPSSSGTAYDAVVNRTGRQLHYRTAYDDRSPGFVAEAGFVPRTAVRELNNFIGYDFRPEGPRVISWGPQVRSYEAWDHEGHHLNRRTMFAMASELAGSQTVSAFYQPAFEALGPRDNPALDRFRSYQERTFGITAGSRHYRPVAVDATWETGTAINIDPPAGAQPELANRIAANVMASIKPSRQLRIDSTYLFLRLSDPHAPATIVANHIVRTKSSWQFTPALSARVIVEYDAVLADALRTSLATTRKLNSDVLVTYLVHPGTALYVGYNADQQNLELVPAGSGAALVRTDRLNGDSHGLFVKASYLVRF